MLYPFELRAHVCNSLNRNRINFNKLAMGWEQMPTSPDYEYNILHPVLAPFHSSKGWRRFAYLSERGC